MFLQQELQSLANRLNSMSLIALILLVVILLIASNQLHDKGPSLCNGKCITQIKFLKSFYSYLAIPLFIFWKRLAFVWCKFFLEIVVLGDSELSVLPFSVVSNTIHYWFSLLSFTNLWTFSCIFWVFLVIQFFAKLFDCLNI